MDRQRLRPLGPLRFGNIALTTIQETQFSDVRTPLRRFFRFDAGGTLRSNWRLASSIGLDLPSFDQEETRGGPLFPRPWRTTWATRVTSDASKPVSASLLSRLQISGTGWRWSPRLDVSALAFDRLALNFQLGMRLTRSEPFFYATLRFEGLPETIVGDLDFNEAVATGSFTYAFDRRLTLQFFGQLLRAVGRYDRYYKLIESSTRDVELEETNFALGEDFVRLSFVSNTVLRFDLGGGTAALAAYRVDGVLSRRGLAAPYQVADGLGRLVGDSLSHQLTVKLSYAWDFL